MERAEGKIGENLALRYLERRGLRLLERNWRYGHLEVDLIMEDDLYFRLGDYANRQANKIRQTVAELGYELLVPGCTNQIFAILPDALLAELSRNFSFTEQERVDDKHRAVRFCTSWATKEENVTAFLADVERVLS